MPEPHAAFALWRVTMEAMLATMPRKQAVAMLKTVAEIFEDEEAILHLRPLRPSAQHAAQIRARRGAAMMFKLAAPLLLARVRRK